MSQNHAKTGDVILTCSSRPFYCEIGVVIDYPKKFLGVSGYPEPGECVWLVLDENKDNPIFIRDRKKYGIVSTGP